jgi:hypothetical protein
MAEATAEYVHRQIRAEMGIGAIKVFVFLGLPGLPWLKSIARFLIWSC